MSARFLRLQEGQAAQAGSTQPPAQASTGQALRMLAAFLDASTHAQMQGKLRSIRAQLRGLRLETRVDLAGHASEVGCVDHCDHVRLHCN